MKLVNNGPVYSKHGFVFVSINHVLKLSSIIKSNPNNSKQFSLLNGSNNSAVA